MRAVLSSSWQFTCCMNSCRSTALSIAVSACCMDNVSFWCHCHMSRRFAFLQEFVKETYFNSERELISDQPEEIVEQKERIVSVTPKDPCGCVTGNEYGIQGFSGLPRSHRGSGRQEMF